jgi:hypothetical protein
MVAFSIIMIAVIGALLLVSRATGVTFAETQDHWRPITRYFLWMSPLPMFLTIVVPVIIGVASNFTNSRSTTSFISGAGCWLSVILLVAGMFLSGRAIVLKFKNSVPLFLATCLALCHWECCS